MAISEVELVEQIESEYLRAPAVAQASADFRGVTTAILIGFKDDGRVPIVWCAPAISPTALAARSTIDLHSAHIGREVALMFENADPQRPLIMGLLQTTDSARPPLQSEHLEIEAEGERLIVSAREQLVIRCGKASITLTKAGKILIQGAYVSSRSSGVLRLKGGSVQLN